MAERWYAVQTEPAKERLAERTVAQLGFGVWLPIVVIRRYPCHRRFRSNERSPLIPGYVFACFDRGASGWGEINHALGVIGLVGGGAEPLPVRQCDFDHLRRLAGEKGKPMVIDLPPGTPMRVLSGPFAEKIGPFVSAQDGEITLELDILGRSVATTLLTAQVQPA